MICELHMLSRSGYAVRIRGPTHDFVNNICRHRTIGTVSGTNTNTLRPRRHAHGTDSTVRAELQSTVRRELAFNRVVFGSLYTAESACSRREHASVGTDLPCRQRWNWDGHVQPSIPAESQPRSRALSAGFSAGLFRYSDIHERACSDIERSLWVAVSTSAAGHA